MTTDSLKEAKEYCKVNNLEYINLSSLTRVQSNMEVGVVEVEEVNTQHREVVLVICNNRTTTSVTMPVEAWKDIIQQNYDYFFNRASSSS